MSQGVSVKGLVRRFGHKVVINQLNLEVPYGQFVCLLGRSGCGKTTLLRTIAGLEAVDAGEVNAPTQKSVVFQDPRLLPWRNVLFNVQFGDFENKVSRTKALAALEEVGLSDYIDAFPLTLSGGQAQRVALARALIREPDLLLLDEPFAALDALTKLQMQKLVKDLCKIHNPATILVTHDVSEAIRLADRILVMRDGLFISDINTQQQLNHHSAKHVLTLQERLLDDLQVPLEQRQLN
ncbi:MAG: ABC transporter ATP-binding protein [Acinetobacter populi]|jgi:sulfonate transport system ATP-binding protein|uniref:ABC transporter ATP-binding protein n=1 Tax=Acinetobacter populi TaxID=1582270 RepID=UPI002352ACD8|nr:ABC transporter ATP-binding protein [Acinetobacter populi]MCH4247120.1 ABC transporter ATP-binding protein [Acinetobacter populi]